MFIAYFPQRGHTTENGEITTRENVRLYANLDKCHSSINSSVHSRAYWSDKPCCMVNMSSSQD